MRKNNPHKTAENPQKDELLSNEPEAQTTENTRAEKPILKSKHWKQNAKIAIDAFFNANPQASITALLSVAGEEQQKEVVLDKNMIEYALLFGFIYNEQKEVFKIEKDELIEITNKLK